MFSRPVLVLPVLLSIPLFAAAPTSAAGEYAKHFGALGKLSVEVADAMPPAQYGFRPHPESMDFGALMSHIATTNYQFCAGLKDSDPPALPLPTQKDAVVKFLSDSFDYCSGVISGYRKSSSARFIALPMEGSRGGRSCSRCTFMSRITAASGNLFARQGIKPPGYRI